MHSFPVLLAAVAGQILVAMTTAASAQCTTQQYIAHGRAGLSDAQIRGKCRTAIPGWLSGQWRVTLRLENFSVGELKRPVQQPDSFNPFTQGMKSFTDIADRPDREREELWLVGVRNGKLSVNRIYHPKHNPGSAPFTSVLADRKQSGHRLATSGLDKSHLKVEMVSPPYGNEGIDKWFFDIDLSVSNGQRNQLPGHYRVTRENLLSGKVYSHNGLMVLTKVK